MKLSLEAVIYPFSRLGEEENYRFGSRIRLGDCCLLLSRRTGTHFDWSSLTIFIYERNKEITFGSKYLRESGDGRPRQKHFRG